MSKLFESASQTAGPYVHIGCVPNFCGIPDVYPNDLGERMVTDATPGERISITGAVYDGTGAPLKDVLVEIWQANSDGHYGSDASGFNGWGRQAGHGETGVWQFDTIKPGPVTHASGHLMAPHITFWIVARGINIGLHTRMYFPEDAAAHAGDPVLARIEHKPRIATLLASRQAAGMYHFNIYLQGPQETVFFDV
ncbi:protocatechuate 3,4-dioxygenase subunit alpha [uncultured Roseobacter sp.]|uniref:protocatechuate 3,4-dioxygenase subunit alpha n=1 Tax=uncultured Roseobacter sp. TaxID=114847 RepID=UPI0026173CB4|nr:protocatechuate 3,4-dioxygenase subunit alpha [uncultured Roseobacter sp.]